MLLDRDGVRGGVWDFREGAVVVAVVGFLFCWCSNGQKRKHDSLLSRTASRQSSRFLFRQSDSYVDSIDW